MTRLRSPKILGGLGVLAINSLALCLSLVACGSSGDDGPPPARTELGCAVTDFSVCGYPLDDLSDVGERIAYTATFPNVLNSWGQGGRCDDLVVRGRCADGKQFLYLDEPAAPPKLRYFDGDTLVGVVLTREASTCGDPCPFEDFYGTLESVACASPEFAQICSGQAPGALLPGLPFAGGSPVQPCTECTQ